jgi:hypothetical protein
MANFGGDAMSRDAMNAGERNLDQLLMLALAEAEERHPSFERRTSQRRSAIVRRVALAIHLPADDERRHGPGSGRRSGLERRVIYTEFPAALLV